MTTADRPGLTVVATHATVRDAVSRGGLLQSYLVVIENEVPVARYPIGLKPLTVGRDPSRDVVLADAQVSRLHLQVFLAEGRVMVEDLGSSNGTFLEGVRLAGRSVLEIGRSVRVGSRSLLHERRDPREIAREDDLRRDLDKARRYVQSLLPAPLESGPVRTDWIYEPSTALGGDAFSCDLLDDGHLMAYLVDVSGHGVGAAMHSVSVLNLLRQRALPGTDLRNPAEVLERLNSMFQMDDHDGLYFTIWYGVYSLADRRLAYASAGHHPAYLYQPGQAPVPLKTPGPMIGASPGRRYATGTTDVQPGAALYLFSDGVFEITTPAGRECTLEEFLLLLDGAAPATGAGEAARIYRAVRERSRTGPLDDDFSLLILRFN